MNGAVMYYVYDSEDVIMEYDGLGGLEASYKHGPGIDEPVEMNRNSSAYYYTFDGLGSVVDLTGGNEQVVEQYTYDAFGKIETPPATGNPYTYTSREYDSESGLYFYRARYYDSSIGRFITADPIGFAGGDVNFYGYVGNNPVNFVDPEGLFSPNLIDSLPKISSCTSGLLKCAMNIEDLNKACNEECGYGQKSLYQCAINKCWVGFQDCLELALPLG